MAERDDQKRVVGELRRAGYEVFAIRNEAHRGLGEQRDIKAMGVRSGVSDLLIMDSCVSVRGDSTDPGEICKLKGCFVEMKTADRQSSFPSNDREREQLAFLNVARYLGYAAIVGFGADDAIRKLRALGYRL